MAKSATPSLREAAFKRAGGQCQCAMKTCSHHTNGRRCPANLRGEWELHRIDAGGSYTLSNVLAMCQTCHRNTPTYGVGHR
jgi:hypothetical protein